MRIVQGEDELRGWTPEGGREKVFCVGCGSALFSRHPEDPELIGVRMGTFDRDPGVRASYRQFVSSAAAWEPIPDDGLPRFAEGRPGGFTAPA